MSPRIEFQADDSADPDSNGNSNSDSSPQTPILYSVDVTLLGDDEIAALNRDYRHKNKPTDVLSFSLWEGEQPMNITLPQDEIPLGDLVISVETAARQAVDLKHSLECETEFLAVHGALHLLGYDHIRAADRRVMWRWQEKIVEKLKIAN